MKQGRSSNEQIVRILLETNQYRSVNGGCSIRHKTMYWWLHDGYMSPGKKAKSPEDRAKCLTDMGWLMGLEPTTTGITILDSTN
jgi:hypothetical protein